VNGGAPRQVAQNGGGKKKEKKSLRLQRSKQTNYSGPANQGIELDWRRRTCVVFGMWVMFDRLCQYN